MIGAQIPAVRSTLSIRIGMSFASGSFRRWANRAVHSSVVKRLRSRYAEDRSNSTGFGRPSASCIRSTKLSPAGQSTQSSSVG